MVDSNDVVLKKNNQNIFDVSFDKNGDLETNDFLDTSLIRTIYGERRALKNEVQEPEFRRGWIGNVTRNFEDGSKVWLYEQAKLNRTTINGIKDELNIALVWLLDFKAVISYSVEIKIDSDFSLIADIKIVRSLSKVENRFYKLFENSGE